MRDIQKEIKEALEKVTPGPWEFERTGPFTAIVVTDKIQIVGNTSVEYALLIAEAPTWLLHQQELIEKKEKALREQFEINTKLVVRLEQKDSEYSKLFSDWQLAGRGLDVRMEEINRLREENNKLVEALIREREDAKVWDGIGVVNRINQVLKGVTT